MKAIAVEQISCVKQVTKNEWNKKQIKPIKREKLSLASGMKSMELHSHVVCPHTTKRKTYKLWIIDWNLFFIAFMCHITTIYRNAYYLARFFLSLLTLYLVWNFVLVSVLLFLRLIWNFSWMHIICHLLFQESDFVCQANWIKWHVQSMCIYSTEFVIKC